MKCAVVTYLATGIEWDSLDGFKRFNFLSKYLRKVALRHFAIDRCHSRSILTITNQFVFSFLHMFPLDYVGIAIVEIVSSTM